MLFRSEVSHFVAMCYSTLNASMYFAVVQLCMSSESVVTFPMHEKEKYVFNKI